MPVPRVPEENPEDEAIIGEMRTDAELDQLYAAAHASRELDRLMPTVRQILTESGKLQDSNPSASVVWSVQALEFFLKMGVLRPALRYRLGFDTALSDKVFKDLIGRNGSAEAKKWLNRIFGLNVSEHMIKVGHRRLWSNVWAEPTGRGGGDEEEGVFIVTWRDRIIHRAHTASTEEAKKVLQIVSEFIEVIRSLLQDVGKRAP